jgi:hypothetical protein
MLSYSGDYSKYQTTSMARKTGEINVAGKIYKTPYSDTIKNV